MTDSHAALVDRLKEVLDGHQAGQHPVSALWLCTGCDWTAPPDDDFYDLAGLRLHRAHLAAVLAESLRGESRTCTQSATPTSGRQETNNE